MRVNFNATVDELEQCAGSCESMAKNASDGTLAAFLAGAAAGIDMLPSCRKPDAFGSLIAAEFEACMGHVRGGAV